MMDSAVMKEALERLDYSKKFLAWRPWFIVISFSTFSHMLRAQCKSTERNHI